MSYNRLVSKNHYYTNNYTMKNKKGYEGPLLYLDNHTQYNHIILVFYILGKWQKPLNME